MRQEWIGAWQAKPLSPEQRRWVRRSMYIAVASAPLLIFVLPLLVPTPPARTISASYVSGFNNSVAIFFAVLLALLLLLLAFLERKGARGEFPPRPREATLPFWLVAAVVFATALLQSFAGWVVLAAHARNIGDAGYIIEQATVRADTGRALYTGIEFAYGPLLLLPEVWLSRLLGCSVGAAYFALFVVQAALGLLMLSYVLNALPIRSSLRKATFICLALAAITPHWGMNYTLFRFASPLFVLLWATRVRSTWRCTALLTLGVLLVAAISPELGLALTAGVVVFGLLRALQSGWRWLPAAAIPAGTLALMLLTVGRPYLRMAAIFSRGALNLPVGPYPPILLLLTALLWLVPRMLARFVDLSDEQGARLLASYTVSLAFLPAALGRCDPLHVMFNGTGIWVLAAMAFEQSTAKLRGAWMASLAFLVLWDHRVNDRLFQFQDVAMLRRAVLDRLPAARHDAMAHALAHHNDYREFLLGRQAPRDQPLDMARLRQFVGDAPVVTPAEISPEVEQQLRQAHLYSPGFFAFWSDTMNDATEQQIVNFTNAHEWMLLPSSWQQGYLQLPRDTGLFQGLNLHYRQRKPVLYCPGAMFNADVQDHWTAVWSFGSNVLYRHTDHTRGVDPADLDRDCDQPTL